jgi:hypothetical protein
LHLLLPGGCLWMVLSSIHPLLGLTGGDGWNAHRVRAGFSGDAQLGAIAT